MIDKDTTLYGTKIFNNKTIKKDSHFEITKISKVFCGYYRFEMTIIFTAKSFPYDKKYDYHFES